MSNPDSNKCYLDIEIGEKYTGRLIFELRPEVAPKTVENFKGLCSGVTHKGYKGTTLHRIIPGFMAQAFRNGSDCYCAVHSSQGGDCGTSIYNRRFEDESFELPHDKRGVLSMANRGPNTNNTQFFVTFAPAPHLDGYHVVFGSLVEGHEVLDAIEKVGSPKGKTSLPVVIADSGILLA